MNKAASKLGTLKHMLEMRRDHPPLGVLNHRFGWPVAFTLMLGLIFLLATACGDSEADTTASESDTSDYDTSQTTQAIGPEPVAAAGGELSAAAEEGRKLFIANCAQCHGRRADGTTQGPPLVHQIYEPGHHANASFVIAVTRGVRAHHWEFGNMPAVSGLSIDDIHQVICYVRELQVANGITDKVPSSTPC